MEQEQYPCPGPAMDREAFERVWRRVMPEERPDCPFTLDQAPAPRQEAPVPPAAPVPPPAVSCLGESSQAYAPALLAHLGDVVDAYRVYRALARRGEKTFAAIAADKQRQAKRLAAAYFLITGTPYTAKPTPMPRPMPLPQAIRERYQWEQAKAAAFRKEAAAVADPCLAELYTELADESEAHAQRLRGIMERL